MKMRLFRLPTLIMISILCGYGFNENTAAHVPALTQPNVETATSEPGPVPATCKSAKSESFQESSIPEQPKSFDQLKRVLKDRYDGKVLVIAVRGLSAGEYKKELFGSGDASLFWHHFHDSVTVPKRIRSGPLSFVGKNASEMEQLDDRTFADLNKGLNVSALEKGEPVKVHKFYVYPDYIEFDLTTTKVGHMRNLDMNKASKDTTTTVSGGEVNQNVSVGGFGLVFRFYFDKEKILKAADYETIVAEINKYLLPKGEAETALNAERNIQVDIGMSEEAIIQKLGQPLKTIRVGNQKFLKYQDMTIILKDGKVTEVTVE